MGQFTPHVPDVLGIEWPGLFPLSLPLSQGIERGQTLHSTVSETISGASFPILGDPGGSYREYGLVTVYPKGHETAIGDIAIDRIPVLAGSLASGATFLGGATSTEEALNTAGDGKGVRFPAAMSGALCDVAWATEGLFSGRRILRLGLDYEMVVNFDFPVGLNLELLRVSDSKIQVYGDLVPSSFAARSLQNVNLGEISPLPSTIDPNSSPDRFAWSVDEVGGFSTGAATESYRHRFVNFTDNDITLYYAQLVVTHCVENRLACGAWRFNFQNPLNPGPAVAFVRAPNAVSAGWSKAAGEDYTVTLTAGDAGGPFMDASLSNIEAFGAPPQIPTLDGISVFAPHEGRQAPRGRFNELTDAPADSRITPVVLFNGSLVVSVDSMPYQQQQSPPIFTGAEALQGIVQLAVASGTPYPFMRFYARRVGEPPGPLYLNDAATGGTGGHITRTAFDALPDLTEPADRRSSGWRLVEMHVSPPITFDNSGTVKQVRFSAAGGDNANYWQVLGMTYVESDPQATYGGSSAELADSLGTHAAADLAVMFGTDPPVIAGLRADVGFFNLLVGDDCDPAPGEFPLIAYAALRWSPTAVANFDYYEVQRVDTFESDGFGDGPAWKPIAKIHNQANASFFDMEWRVQRTSAYRVRIVRTDGFYGPWPLIVTLANQPSLFDHQFEFDFGTLILTSNVAPQMSMAVQAVYDDAQDGWTFPEAETVQIERFFGRDYQAGFKPTERGGSRFTRTVMVNPSRFTPPGHITSDSAFERLRDLAWADLPYVCVKDDLGQRWLATIRVPDGTTRRRAAAYLAPNLRPAIVMAQMEVIEATRDPFPAEWNVFQALPPTEPDVEVSPTHGSVA